MPTHDPGNIAAIRNLLNAGPCHVHFVGIGGVGMAGLASLLKSAGFQVTGCDLDAKGLTGWLRDRGINVHTGHSRDHITADVSFVVRTSAVSPASGEIAAAVARGLKVFLRGETLAAYLHGKTSVAVAGTHGKTTVTGFIAQVLRNCGADPSFCIGGEIEPLGGVAGAGAGKVIVVEADESDGTLALYEPDYAVVTNIEPDHLENFGSLNALEECFGRFVRRARRAVIYCADDPAAAALCGTLPNGISYGFSAKARIGVRDISGGKSDSSFTVTKDGADLGRVILPVPGKHNIANALACIAVAGELGIAFEDIGRALGGVVLPRRRFDRVVQREDICVVSDYAHHPSEIRALVKTTRDITNGRILAVFQPHRYSRTKALGKEFPASFEGVDELVLTPVYAASEKPLEGGTIWDLYSEFRAAASVPGDRSPARPAARVATSLEQAWGYLRTAAGPGDWLLVVGAGDVEKIATWAREEWQGAAGDKLVVVRGSADRLSGWAAWRELTGQLEATVFRYDEPLGRKTTMGTGGKADVWAEIGTRGDLGKLLRWTAAEHTPFHIVGAGSNVLISDLGVRGIVARLTGKEFRTIGGSNGSVTVGAGLMTVELLNWCEKRGCGGLEFLEGIPGAVGGALRMNAGAWGECIGNRVAWVRMLNESGEETIITDPKFGYRSGVVGGVVVEAALAVTQA